MLTGLHNIPVRNIRHGLILISSASFFGSDLRTVRKHSSLRDNNAGKICDAALGGTSLFPTGKSRRQGEEILNNMEGGEGGWGRKEWIFFETMMELGWKDGGRKNGWNSSQPDETWMAGWMGLWSPGEPLIGEPSMEEREPCPSSLSCNFCLPYLIHLLASIKFNYKQSWWPARSICHLQSLHRSRCRLHLWEQIIISLLFSIKHRYYHYLFIYSFIIILIIQVDSTHLVKASLFRKTMDKRKIEYHWI